MNVPQNNFVAQNYQQMPMYSDVSQQMPMNGNLSGYNQPQMIGSIPMGQQNIYPVDLQAQLNNYQSIYQNQAPFPPQMSMNQSNSNTNLSQIPNIQDPSLHMMNMNNSQNQLPVINNLNSLN